MATPSTNRARWAFAAGLAAWLGLLLAAAPPWGRFSVSDDWCYSDSVRWLIEEGRLRLSELPAPTAILHIIWGALWCLPGGFSVSTLRLSTIAAGAGAAAGMYAYLAELGAAPAACALGAALLAFDPVFVGASYSFFTDVPFLALFVWSLWALERGLKGDRKALWLGSALASAAFLSRQLALAPLLAAALELRRSKAKAKDWLALLALPALVVAAHGLWFHLVRGVTLGYRFQEAEAFRRLHDPRWWKYGPIDRAGLTLQYLGLALTPLLPTVLWGLGRRRPTRRAILTALAAAACLSIAYAHYGPFPNVPDQLSWKGLGYISPAGWLSKQADGWESPRLWWTWNVLAILTALTVALRGGFERRGLRLAGWSALFLFVPMVFHPPLYDRYFLVFMPSALALCLAGAAETLPVSWALALSVAGLSVLGMRDFVRWNQALWSAGETAEALGLKPEEVSGGLSWDGAHSADRNVEKLMALGAKDPLQWWTLNSYRALITFDPNPPAEGFERGVITTYETPLLREPGKLYVFVAKPPTR